MKEITLGQVVRGEKTLRQYFKDCAKRNKNQQCFRQRNAQNLCKDCLKKPRPKHDTVSVTVPDGFL